MIIVFVGPPKSGKDTQARLLGQELGLPVLSMGDIIREERKLGNPVAIQAFDEFSMKGLHVPTAVKFPFLRERLDNAPGGFILDNFPATKDDLDVFVDFLNEKNLKADKTFYIKISVEEMMRRTNPRGREDDAPEVIVERRKIQDEDRKPILEFFTNQGTLEEINGEREVSTIHGDIMSRLGISNREKNGH